jgi:hypothetical protein
VDLLRQRREHDRMIKTPEAVGDVPLDEPVRSLPYLHHLRQRGVAAPLGAETMRAIRELDVVVRLKQQTHNLRDQLVAPGRHAQRALPDLLRDVDPPGRGPPVGLRTQSTDDPVDLGQGHAVHGLAGDSRRHCTLVGVDAPVGQQEQLLVEQLPVQPLQRQAAPAALPDDAQHGFSTLHYASLPV